MVDKNGDDRGAERGTKTENALGTSMERRGDTVSMALAAQAEAEVKARFAMAQYRPRNTDQYRDDILKACKRPRFAKSARYEVPRGGKKLRGPSIRFADEATKHFGNIDVQTSTVYDDDDQRLVRTAVTDLETNVTKAGTLTIRKVVERREVRDGMEIVSSRKNTTGQKVYLVRATEADFYNAEHAACAKMRRNLELQLLPSDITDEAMDLCVATEKADYARDPDAARKAVLDAFSEIGVRPIELQKYLGHGVDTCSPDELEGLRSIFTAIRDGRTTWTDIMAEASATPIAGEKPAKKGTEGAKEELRKKREEKSGEKSEPEPVADAGPESDPEPDPESEPKSDPEKPKGRVTAQRRTAARKKCEEFVDLLAKQIGDDPEAYMLDAVREQQNDPTAELSDMKASDWKELQATLGEKVAELKE